MKGDAKVIEALNEVLAAELAAISQYMVHAELCGDWGFSKLHDVERQQAIEEMHHAEILIERIVLLEGRPEVQHPKKIQLGTTVPEMLQFDLDLEVEAVRRLGDLITVCEEARDHMSRQLLEQILADEEKHADWLETQLNLIKHVGEQYYLAQQLGGPPLPPPTA